MCIEIGVREERGERGERREEIGKGGAHARKRVERRDLSGALDGQCIEATETKAVFRALVKSRVPHCAVRRPHARGTELFDGKEA